MFLLVFEFEVVATERNIYSPDYNICCELIEIGNTDKKFLTTCFNLKFEAIVPLWTCPFSVGGLEFLISKFDNHKRGLTIAEIRETKICRFHDPHCQNTPFHYAIHINLFASTLLLVNEIGVSQQLPISIEHDFNLLDFVLQILLGPNKHFNGVLHSRIFLPHFVEQLFCNIPVELSP
jgi:hypothetical protein